MSRSGPETKLVIAMRKAGHDRYGGRLVLVKYHGSPFSEAGVSDLIGCLDGVFVAIEVKSPDASEHKRATVEASIQHALEHGPTIKQRSFVANVLASGGCAGFAATVEQFMEILNHADERDQTERFLTDTAIVCHGHNILTP